MSITISDSANAISQESIVAAQPYPSVLQPRLTGSEPTPFITSVILNAAIEEHWPPYKKAGTRRKVPKIMKTVGRQFGAATCALILPTALPQGCSLDVARRTLEALRREVATSVKEYMEIMAEKAKEWAALPK